MDDVKKPPHLPAFMDSMKVPLSPCSLETIHEPLQVDEGRSVWPLIVSCYQLDESVGHRRGQLELYHVEVPYITSTDPTLPLKFGRPEVILEPADTSGILDGKWWSQPACRQTQQQHKKSTERLFATAHASGEIQLRRLKRVRDESVVSIQHRYKLDFVAQSSVPPDDRGIPPLCLSLNWGVAAVMEDTDPSKIPIVSTYSNGKVAVHDVLCHHATGEYTLMEQITWDAHNMFTNPAEVWSADFCGGSNLAVVTCGDEGKVKLWDVRATNRPMHVMSPFDAGATCVARHPRNETLLAVGSYDETLCLYDIRLLSTSAPVVRIRSKPLGGGIWRIKWHPYIDNRMLVAAMHGGCRVVQVENWESLSTLGDLEGGGNEEDDSSSSLLQFSLKVTKKFTEHESMAYGADWLVCKHPTRNGFFEAAGSCSFYDRAVFLWDTLQ